MNFICKPACVITICLVAATISVAQFKSNGYEIGLNAGTLIYQGDLSEGALGNYKSLKPAFGVSVSKSLDNFFSVTANLTRGRLLADESTITNPAWRQQRNFSFSSPVTELYVSIG
jgi:hypothetical protein